MARHKGSFEEKYHIQTEIFNEKESNYLTNKLL